MTLIFIKMEESDWEKRLKEEGVVVIPNIWKKKECLGFRARCTELMAKLTRASGEGSIKEYMKKYSPSGVIHGMDNARVLWDVRSHPKVTDIFHQLYSDDPALYLYIDRFNYRPSLLKKQYSEWWHLDEDPHRPMSRYQGFISLTDIRAEDACLGVLWKSHLYTPHMPYGSTINHENLAWLQEEKQCVPHRVACPEGSLVLWDSRTVHSPLNSLCAKPRKRVVVYVRYYPTSLYPVEKRYSLLETRPDLLANRSLDLLYPDEIMNRHRDLVLGHSKPL